MIPQVHFNFGPTSFDRFYQLSLPLIPGGVFAGGLMITRADLTDPLRNAFAFHPYVGIAAFLFAAYVLGFVFFGLGALLTGSISAVAQGFAFRSWTPARWSYVLSQCTIWRQVATSFLGSELAPEMPKGEPTCSAFEKIKAQIAELGNKRRHDELWEEWYRILQDYLLRDVPLISNDVLFVWVAIQGTGWAMLTLSVVSPRLRHWSIYLGASLIVLFSAGLPLLTTLNYLASERLPYWDFTARLLAEVRGVNNPKMKETSSDEKKI